MKVTAYFIGWNIPRTIALTIRHYQQYCKRIVYYDNHSDDHSRQIAEAFGCEVRLFGTPGVLSDADYMEVKNNCWRGDDSDYVIVCDDDEILYDKNLLLILRDGLMNRATLFRTQGYSIFSEDVPRETWLQCVRGVKDDNYSKSIVFSPKLKGINFVYGAHVAKPEGDLTWYQGAPIPVLHYRAVGGVQRLIDRQSAYVKRFSEINKRWGLGSHYSESEEKKRSWFESNLKNSVPLFSDGGLLSKEIRPNLLESAS